MESAIAGNLFRGPTSWRAGEYSGPPQKPPSGVFALVLSVPFRRRLLRNFGLRVRRSRVLRPFLRRLSVHTKTCCANSGSNVRQKARFARSLPKYSPRLLGPAAHPLDDAVMVVDAVRGP